MPDYVAPAVHFNGVASLLCSSLAAVNGSTSTYVGWFKFEQAQTKVQNNSIWAIDPSGSYAGYAKYGQVGSGPQTSIGVASSGGTAYSTNGTIPAGVWVCLMCSLKNGGTSQIYINDTPQGMPVGVQNSGNNSINSLQFRFGDDGTIGGAIFDVADFRMWTNQAVDLTNVANRRMFIDAGGKPVDPGVSTLTLGLPTVYFSGNAANFTRNRGTGGPFAIQNGVLTNAVDSPSAPTPLYNNPNVVSLYAPRPYFELYAGGKLNVADGDGLFKGVLRRDVQDFITAGCTVVGTTSSYVAPAVHFDGNTYLANSSLAANPYSIQYLSSKWVKIPSVGGSSAWLIVSDPTNLQRVYEGQKSGIPNQWDILVSNTDGSHSLAITGQATIPYDTWVHVLVYVKTSQASGQKILQIYINDVPYAFTVVDAQSGFYMSTAGLPVIVGGSTNTNFVGDVSDLMVWMDVDFDLSVTANRRLFINSLGKPAHPSNAINALGDPVLQFSGDAGPLLRQHSLSPLAPTLKTSYVAKAVHLDGATSIYCNSLSTGPDTPYFSMSFWCRGFIGQTTPPAAQYENGALITIDPDNFYWPIVQGSFQNPNAMIFTFEDFISANLLDTNYPSPPLANELTWHHFLVSVDSSQPQGMKPLAIYLDDVNITALCNPDDESPDNGGVFYMPFNNLPVRVLGDGIRNYPIGDVADLWIAPGVSLLQGNDIPEATRRIFTTYDGYPQDPAGFPTAAMIFSGDHTNFFQNRGTGGSFVVDNGALTDATTSPSTVYHAPAVHFDGSSFLHCPAMTGDDTSIFTLAGWFKADPTSANNTFFMTRNTGGGVMTNLNIFPQGGYDLAMVEDPSVEVGDLHAYNAPGTGPVTTGEWHHILMGALLQYNNPDRYFTIYIDGKPANAQNIQNGGDFGVELTFQGMPGWFGSDGAGGNIIIDCADVWIMTSTYFGNYLENSFDDAMVRLFIDSRGRPQDPAVALNYFGQQTMLFSGNAANFKNLGYNGTFTVTGTLTDATTSPSDLPPPAGDVASFSVNQGSGGTFVTTGTLTNATTSPST